MIRFKEFIALKDQYKDASITEFREVLKQRRQVANASVAHIATNAEKPSQRKSLKQLREQINQIKSEPANEQSLFHKMSLKKLKESLFLRVFREA